VSGPRDAASVSVREGHELRGRRAAQRIRTELGRELLIQRRQAGVSQETVGRAAGMSRAQFGRIERGEIRGLTVDQASRAAAAVGLSLVVKTYPDGDPARDAAHLALGERFRGRLPPAASWRTEVPIPIPGDRRAWDGVAALHGRQAGSELETRLHDVQALERRLTLKQRDGDVDIVLLVVADTTANRRLLEQHREQLRRLLPLDSRQVLDAFRRGALPERSGIVIV
jgi:transcriptional regulator with XRE-family HTH domain